MVNRDGSGSTDQTSSGRRSGGWPPVGRNISGFPAADHSKLRMLAGRSHDTVTRTSAASIIRAQRLAHRSPPPSQDGVHSQTMSDLIEIIRNRHSERVPFDPEHAPSDADLHAILEAARWAPTKPSSDRDRLQIESTNLDTSLDPQAWLGRWRH